MPIVISRNQGSYIQTGGWIACGQWPMTFVLPFLLRGEGLLCPVSSAEVKRRLFPQIYCLLSWRGSMVRHRILTHLCNIPSWASGP